MKRQTLKVSFALIAVGIIAAAAVLHSQGFAVEPSPLDTSPLDDEIVLDETAAEATDGASVSTALPAEIEPVSVAARAEGQVDRLKLSQTTAAADNRARLKAVQTIAKLKSIRGCEVRPTAKCPINHPMAKASADGYAAVLVDQTVAELAFLKALAQREISFGRTPSFSVSAVAGAYVKHRDDHVREQALDLASLLVSSDPKKALQVSASALTSTVSGPLATQALAVMADVYRLQSGRLQTGHKPFASKAVDEVLTRTLTTGGWDVRDAVAENILPFLNADNRATYAQIMDAADVRSKVALHLRLNLEEFDRMQRL